MKSPLSAKLVVLLFIAFQFSCDRAAEQHSSTESALYDVIPGDGVFTADMEVMEDIPVTEQAPLPYKASQDARNQSAANEQAVEKQVIKTARIGYEVDSLALAEEHISSLIKSLQGYIDHSEQRNNERRRALEVKIRVPATNFDKLLAQLVATSASMGNGRLDYKEVSAVDVTSEYIDIQGRLTTKRKVAERYQQLLKKADSVKDVLAIEDKLRIIQEEIEAQEGRLKYLKSQVAYSTIGLNLYQNLEYKYIPAEMPGFGQRVLAALNNGWQLLLGIILASLKIWPLLLIAVFAGLFLWRRRLRNRTSL